MFTALALSIAQPFAIIAAALVARRIYKAMRDTRHLKSCVSLNDTQRGKAATELAKRLATMPEPARALAYRQALRNNPDVARIVAI